MQAEWTFRVRQIHALYISPTTVVPCPSKPSPRNRGACCVLADWLIATLNRKAAHERLEVDGFNCYRPMYRERLVVRGARRYVDRPLLGRYVLVEMLIDWIRQFYRIVRVEGIGGILMRNEKLMVVRNGDVEALRKREVRGYIELPPKVWFRKDQRVIVSRGPFVNLVGRFVEMRGALDVVEIELFGSKRNIVLPAGGVTAA